MSALHLAGTYTRDVAASLARIRENVLDWEHLPALHGSSFAACELVDSDADGWRVRLTSQGAGAVPQQLKLRIAADTSAYTVTTEAGPGAPSEIRVAVSARGPHATHVRVDYHVAECDPVRLARIGAGFIAIYQQLWDEDEAMMQARAAALARRPDVATPTQLDLGREADVRANLPHAFDFGPAHCRLIDLAGTLMAHAATCPHWLGPLDAAPDAAGSITCPWHGYRFDIRTGRSADGRSLRLAPAPRIVIRDGRVIAERPAL